jgi:integrase
MHGRNAKREQVLRDLGVREDSGGLTEAIVNRVLTVPLERRYTLSDSAGRHHVTGLYIRVTEARPGPKGRLAPGHPTYWCQAPLGRSGDVKQVRIAKVGTIDLQEARRRAKALRDRLDRGVDPVAEEKTRLAVERSRVSVRKYIEGDWWTKHARNRKAGAAEQKRLLAAWAELLELRLDEVTADGINAILQARRDEDIAAGTLIRDWTALRSMLGQAKEDGLLPALPFDRRRPPALQGLQGTKRVRWLGQHDPKELEKFEKALAEESAEVQAALKLLALTGMRRGELLGLRKHEVNGKVALIPPERSKSGKARTVRLNAEARKIIKDLKVIDTSGRYFPPTKKGSLDTWKQRLKKAMKRIRAAVGTDDLTLHDLRHHFAVRARQAGAPLEVVRDLLGHADLKSTQIYAHVGESELEDAVSRIKL